LHIEVLKVFHIPGNPESKRFEDNCDWIENTLIQSLEVSGLATIPNERLALVQNQNQNSVRRLIIGLDENVGPNEKVTLLLNAFKNLRILNVSWEITALLKPVPRELEDYRRNAIALTREILKDLVTRPMLRELCIRVDIPLGHDHVIQTFLGLPELPTEEQTLTYPTRLWKLQLVFPIFRALDQTEVTWWTALLDCQTQLRHLTFDLGFLYWSTFRSALRRNSQTLEELDLSLSNWVQLRRRQNWDRNIPVALRFDWRVLLPNAERLKSLRVVMSARCGTLDPRPHKTWHFHYLSLYCLQRLELESVHLTKGHFKKIFRRLPSLKKVKLIHWHDPRLENFPEVATWSLTPVLYVLLRSINLEEIELRDWSLVACPKPLRTLFSSAVPNYTVKFPTGLFLMLADPCVAEPPCMVIARKPTSQLIPPTFS